MAPEAPVLLFLSMAWGADYYADPVNGSAAGDGSAADPWGSLEEIVAAGLFEVSQWDAFPYVEGTSVLVPRTAGPIGPGDTLWLRDGHHGEALIDSAYVEGGTITIAAAAGAHPTLSRVRFRSAQGFVLRGVTVSPSFAPTWSTETLVDLDSHSWTGPVRDITIEDCELYSVLDSSAWTAADWNTLAPNGVQADGTDITLRGNHLLNVNFGLSVSADHSLVERNVVENFAGDGMRGLGDFTTFQYNTVMNCYDVNDNHDDGFQSWSVGPGGVGTGEVTGIVLRGNVILNYVDENQPLRGPLQGIGCFDGTFVDWVIEDNVIVTDHWHGITLLGARGVRVVNNTVVDRNSVSPGPPWISIDDHKDGTPPVGCIVRNNLATDYASSPAVTEDHNLVVTDVADHFVAWPTDLRLIATSAAIDAGTSDLAPATDADGKVRPLGAAVDLGAYEFGDPPNNGHTGDSGLATHTGAPTDTGSAHSGPPETEGDDTTNGSTTDLGEGSGGCGCDHRGGAPWWPALAGLLLAFRKTRASTIPSRRA